MADEVPCAVADPDHTWVAAADETELPAALPDVPTARIAVAAASEVPTTAEVTPRSEVPTATTSETPTRAPDAFEIAEAAPEAEVVEDSVAAAS